ncbi:signal peptidase [Paraburkholderia sp.]|uniref:signal peptidase n=1 Tax=Paraburkholderia sp. TaxID=1926495 RepID=UPI0023848816|nr:signal peptidase [Paraburkholderia sp.]MDE1183546.1 signal peptidase [Paraburkholderia sp.]
MKKAYALAAVAALALSGCATQVKTLPLQSSGERHGDLFYGEQTHPAVKTQLGTASYSVRIARRTDDADTACGEALSTALQKVRQAIQDRHGNAAINIKTRFHSTQSASSTSYTCGVSSSAAAIAVTADIVVLDAQ